MTSGSVPVLVNLKVYSTVLSAVIFPKSCSDFSKEKAALPGSGSAGISGLGLLGSMVAVVPWLGSVVIIVLESPVVDVVPSSEVVVWLLLHEYNITTDRST